MENLHYNKVNLSTENVHVLLINFSTFDFQNYMNYLTSNEIERLDNINNLNNRNQFVASRVVIKKILSKYLKKIPNKIEFSFNKHGKPFIRDKYHNHRFEFNISHSDIYGLIAITLDNKIGVDIQKINHDIDVDSLSSRFFSENEKTQLMNLDKSKKIDAFHLGWARKESFIKAIGEGVAYGLDSFTVSLEKNDTKSILDIKNKKWHCYNIIDFENYKTALTTEIKSKIITSSNEVDISTNF